MPQQHIDYGTVKSGGTVSRAVRRLWPFLLALVVVAATVAFVFWRWTSLRIDEPVGFSSPSIVTDYTGFAPPATATRIQTAGYSHGPIYSHYVRFEAPANVCLAYAQQLAPGVQMTHAEPDCLDAVLTHDRAILTHLGWFDLSQASILVGTTLGGTSGPAAGASIYVDQNRGVFYFFKGF